MGFLIKFLYSWLGLVSWLLMYSGTVVFLIARFRAKGVFISVATFVSFLVLIFGASLVRNRQAMGWDFGYTTAVAVFLAVLAVCIITAAFNVFAVVSSFGTVRAWLMQRGRFPAVEAIPSISFFAAIMLCMVSYANTAYSSFVYGAIFENHLSVVNTLIHTSVLANKNLGEEPGYPLHLAAERGYPDIVRMLLQKGAHPNRPNSHGRRPLDMICCDRYDSSEYAPGHTECATVLIGHEAILSRETVLKLFALPNPEKIMQSLNERLLKKYGTAGAKTVSNLNDSEISELGAFLVAAIRYRYNDIFRQFITQTNLQSITLDDGWGLIDHAFDEGNSYVARYLLSLETANTVTNRSVSIPGIGTLKPAQGATFSALYAIGKVDSATARAYLDTFGISDLDVPLYTTTALTNAIEEGNIPVAALLLKRGANPNAHGQYGVPPLCAAVEKGNIEAIHLLTGHGTKTDINSTDAEGRTPLSIACLNGKSEIAATLLRKHAAADIPDRDGNTPFLLACKYKGVHADDSQYIDILAMLVRCGVNVHAQNTYGETAKDFLKAELDSVLGAHKTNAPL